jgi:hypothetical protein
MPHASHSPDRSPYVVERLYQLAHATAVAADKPNLTDHADAEREAAEEIKRLRRRIEGLEKRLSMLQELAKISFVPDRDFSADPVDEWDGQPMARNPDRDFSAGNLSQQESEELWTLFQRSEVADLFDTSAYERFGRLISRSAFNPTNPGWYSGWAERTCCRLPPSP